VRLSCAGLNPTRTGLLPVLGGWGRGLIELQIPVAHVAPGWRAARAVHPWSRSGGSRAVHTGSDWCNGRGARCHR
jgi:hypothetical protein